MKKKLLTLDIGIVERNPTEEQKNIALRVFYETDEKSMIRLLKNRIEKAIDKAAKQANKQAAKPIEKQVVKQAVKPEPQ